MGNSAVFFLEILKLYLSRFFAILKLCLNIFFENSGRKNKSDFLSHVWEEEKQEVFTRLQQCCWVERERDHENNMQEVVEMEAARVGSSSQRGEQEQ